jgi:hypothetical protein
VGLLIAAAIPGPAGAIALYPALGLLPGLAIAADLAPERGRLATAAIAIAIAPLAASVPGWILIALGAPVRTAAIVVAASAWLAWSLRRGAGPPDEARPDGDPEERRAAWIAAAGALVVIAPMMLNSYLRIRSDAWVHGALVQEILARGVPPEDPRFAGLPLNYVWFFNLFIAMASSLRGHDMFVLMALFNGANLAATLLVAWCAGRRLAGSRAGTGAALLVGLGFNAGVWLLGPLRLVRMVVGRDRGLPELGFELQRLRFLGNADVLYLLTAPFAYMASFLDKFLIGTALNYAYLLLALFLWSMVAWFGGSGPRALALAAAAAAGMLLFHGVVGLSALPVALAVIGIALVMRLRWRWLPSAGRLALFGGATLAGCAAAGPYTWSIARGWPAERSGLHFSYLGLDPWMTWTLVTAVAVAAWIATRPLRRALVERRPDAALLGLWAAGMAGFALVVRLPSMNHVKFIYQTFLPLALIGGSGWHEALRAMRSRLGRPLAALAFAAAFLAPPALTLTGYLLDPGGRTSPALHPSEADRRLHRWAREQTPARSVFLDRDYRSDLMVFAGRQLYLAARQGPELAAFPLDQLRERRKVVDDLYGPLDSLGQDTNALRRLGRPIYVLYRRDDPLPDGLLERVAARPGPFGRVYDRDGLVVYHLQPAPTP